MANSNATDSANSNGKSNLDAAIDAIVDGNQSENLIDAIDPASVERPEPKRGRGRPRKDGNATGSADFSGTKPESKSSAKSAQKIGLDQIAGYLQMAHMGLASVTKNQLFIINENESKKLAESLKLVWDRYDIPLNPAMIAWGQLVITCGAIYGPRIVMAQMQKAQQARQTTAQQAPPMDTTFAAAEMNGMAPH